MPKLREYLKITNINKKQVIFKFMIVLCIFVVVMSTALIIVKVNVNEQKKAWLELVDTYMKPNNSGITVRIPAPNKKRAVGTQDNPFHIKFLEDSQQGKKYWYADLKGIGEDGKWQNFNEEPFYTDDSNWNENNTNSNDYANIIYYRNNVKSTTRVYKIIDPTGFKFKNRHHSNEALVIYNNDSLVALSTIGEENYKKGFSLVIDNGFIERKYRSFKLSLDRKRYPAKVWLHKPK